MNNKLIRPALCLLATLSLCVIPGLAAGSPQFGMVGIGAGQTLRLNVVAYPPNPCVAQIGFLNANGQTPEPEPGKTVNLAPGQAAVADLPAASLGLRFGQRAEFQPVVTLIQPISDSNNAPSACHASVEIFDTATGFSLVAVPEPEPGMPNISPQFGMVGLAAGQTLRLNVVAFPPNPCVGQIGFLNSNGQIPQPEPGKPVALNPGQSAVFDVPAAALGLRFGQRAELQAFVTLQPAPNGVAACKATAEVYDTVTGRTWAVLQPEPEPSAQ